MRCFGFGGERLELRHHFESLNSWLPAADRHRDRSRAEVAIFIVEHAADGEKDCEERRDNSHADDRVAQLEWAGGAFDPEKFDLEYVNSELRKIFRLLD